MVTTRMFPELDIQAHFPDLRDILMTNISRNTKETLQPPPLGNMWATQGGFYVGDFRSGEGPDYHLIVAPAYTDILDLTWGAFTDEDRTYHSRDGAANCKAMCRSHDDLNQFPAIQHATTSNFSGYADWYLPSSFELLFAYVNAPDIFFPERKYWASTSDPKRSEVSAFCLDASSHGLVSMAKSCEATVRPFRRIYI